MKLLSIALIASVIVAGYSHAQTATPGVAPPATAAVPTPSSSSSSSSAGSQSLGHACKEEVKKLCGHAHGQEMQDCVKSGVDLNKFSADCKTKLSQTAKPSG
jgi:hypothetical protein